MTEYDFYSAFEASELTLFVSFGSLSVYKRTIDLPHGWSQIEYFLVVSSTAEIISSEASLVPPSHYPHSLYPSRSSLPFYF